METPTYVALSRQIALRRQMEIVAHNLANATTPGYKAEGIVFTEYLIKAENPVRLSYTQDLGSYRDFREGPLVQTGNDLDLAIQGNGFFVVQTPDGQRYTRGGRFQLDAAGQIVTSAGYPVLASGAPIIIDPDNGPVEIAADGTVPADLTQGGNSAVTYGKLDVVAFDQIDQLRSEENALYRSEQPAQPTTEAFVRQRMLEQSNVQTIKELTDMIWVQRNYQASQRLMENEHERQRRAINYIIPSA